MKIVRPYAKMLTPWAGDEFEGGDEEGFQTPHVDYGAMALEFVEWCGRISHRSEEEQKENGFERFLRTVVLGHGDWSITEHVSISVDMLVDRGVTHELVRHRIASYTQESTRFVNYAKKMPPSFIYPIPEVECPYCLDNYEPQPDYGPHMNENSWVHDMALTPDPKNLAFLKDCVYDTDWLDGIRTAEEKYKKLLSKGWRPQEARSVFPNALASRIIVTMNLRSWRQVFLMRTTKEAHPQMRQVMIPLLEEFKKVIPVLYEDIEPEARQVDNLKKGR